MNAVTTGPTTNSRPRRGRTAHQLTVNRVQHPVPRVVRVTLQGDSLATSTPPNPGGHIKIAFGSTNGGPPTMRTYTPRRFDPERLELDIEFVLHGEGVASSWAAAAQIGDELTVMGPGGRYTPAAPSGVFVIVVDDTAMPAAGTVIEALPVDTEVIVICEVTDRRDERSLTEDRDLDVTWLHRSEGRAEPGALLRAAVQDLPQNSMPTGSWPARPARCAESESICATTVPSRRSAWRPAATGAGVRRTTPTTTTECPPAQSR